MKIQRCPHWAKPWVDGEGSQGVASLAGFCSSGCLQTHSSLLQTFKNCVCVWGGLVSKPSTLMEARGQFCGVSSLLLPLHGFGVEHRFKVAGTFTH